MLTSRQRSQLRAMAHTMQPELQIGKGGISEALLRQIDESLEAHELIKISILQSYDADPYETCDIVCEKLQAEPVQCIGRRFVIYRPSEDKPSIVLEEAPRQAAPKAKRRSNPPTAR